MDITQNLPRIVKLYQDHFGTIFLVTLIACALSGLSCGLLAGPFLGGLLLYNLRLWQGRSGNLSLSTKEIFGHFDQAFPCLLLSLLTGVVWYIATIIGHIPLVGRLFVFVFNPLLLFVFNLALLFIFDRGYDLIPALTGACGIILTNPLNIALYGLIIGLLGLSGILFLFLPVVLTIPIAFLGASLAYYELSATASETLHINRQTLLLFTVCTAVSILVGVFFKYSGL